MKELIVMVNIIISLTMNVPQMKTDYQLMYDYCDRNYPNYTVCVFTEWNEDIILNRANTNTVYVEKYVSISDGIGSGYGKDGGYVTYNKIVPQGEEVISYFVYNPENNYIDDVVAVIDNRILR